MSLQAKVLLFALLAMASLVTALYLGTAKVLLQGFSRVEAASLRRQTNLVKGSFDIDRNALRVLAREMSSSTDLYRFVSNPAQPFVSTGLSQAKLEAEGADFLALVNKAGKVVISQTSTAITPEQRRVSQQIRSSLKPGSPLLHNQTVNDVHVETVILPSSAKPIFVVSSPIVASSLKEPIGGSLVLVRPFAQRSIDALSTMNLIFTLSSINGFMPQEERAIATLLQAKPRGEIVERAQGKTRISAYTFLPDELGSAPFLLEVSIPRRIYAQALQSRSALLLVVLLACTLFLLLALYFVHRAILSRLHLLSQGLHRIAREENAAERLNVSGHDEFTRLAADTNQMLDVLEVAQREAQENAERYALVTEGIKDGVWDWDIATGDIYNSPRFRSMLGYPEEAFMDRVKTGQFYDHMHPDDRGRVVDSVNTYANGAQPQLEVELRLRTLDGPYRWMLLRGAARRDSSGKVVRIAGSLTDLTRRGLFDALTGLPNRLFFREHLEQILLRARTVPKKLNALLFVYVNRFNVINDSLGHYYGDLLLLEIAKRLQRELRATDMVARLSSEVFAVMLVDLEDRAVLQDTVQRLLTLTEALFSLEGHQVHTSLSIGVVADLWNYSQVDELLRDAENAMNHAKAKRLPFAYFDSAMHGAAKARLQLEADLRVALEKGELSLAYQPIISLRDSTLYGVEALLRWQHPTRGAVSPDVFIPLAEEAGLITTLGEWVLRQACSQIEQLPGTFSVSVNVSSEQFDDGLVSVVDRVLSETGLPPERLVLEVTESAVIDDATLAADILARLRALGVRTALDDFGTGYSSLSYLSDLPLNVLKIDRSFIARLLTDSKSIAIVQAMIGLSQVMALKVVAEGVETDDQVTLLKMLECHYVQGYYFYKPLALGAFRELVESMF